MVDDYSWTRGIENPNPSQLRPRSIACNDLNKLVNIKRYGSVYKLTLLKTLPGGGAGMKKDDSHEQVANDQKLKCNISRAKSRIFELAMCNQWEFFVTCTLDSSKYEREDLERFRNDLAQFIRDQRKKWKCEVKYLFIPELHADGKNWHMHGLINGLSLDALHMFDLSDKIPVKMKKNIASGAILFNWADYANKFGWVSLEAVRSKEGVSKYITKYINKNLGKSVPVGSRLFYASKGLQGKELIKKGTLARAPDQWEYENEYVKIKWIQIDEVDYYIRDGTQIKELAESVNSPAHDQDLERP